MQYKNVYCEQEKDEFSDWVRDLYLTFTTKVIYSIKPVLGFWRIMVLKDGDICRVWQILMELKLGIYITD